MVPARIAAIQQETPTVKRFVLQPSAPLRFVPGQWVDLAVRGIAAVGSYTIVTTPWILQQEGRFELAVKRSAHPVAAWLHEQVSGATRPGAWRRPCTCANPAELCRRCPNSSPFLNTCTGSAWGQRGSAGWRHLHLQAWRREPAAAVGGG